MLYRYICATMTTLRLQIADSALEKVLWLLGHFSKDEIDIVEEDADFLKNREEIQKELKRMDAGEATYITTEEMTAKVKKFLDCND